MTPPILSIFTAEQVENSTGATTSIHPNYEGPINFYDNVNFAEQIIRYRCCRNVTLRVAKKKRLFPSVTIPNSHYFDIKIDANFRNKGTIVTP
ncbi:hypothetical protein FHU14_002041 [Mesorhizobium sp. RMAD-H1]|nr:hypothetical protein [Mesorhizobium sp. RMAD-H1]